MTRRRLLVLAAVIGAMALSVAGALARSGDDGATTRGGAAATPSASAAPVPVVVPGRPGESAAVTDSQRVKAPDGSTYNLLDAEFARMMIPHHLQALRMAELAPQRAADPRVKALAERMRLAQAPEITQLRTWLATRGLTERGGHDHTGMPGMQTEAALAELTAARGADFDRRFLQLMDAHHRGAVRMAGDVLAGGDDLTIEQLANEMAVEQSVEIERMRQLAGR
ncbi:MAG TPA: DUF305 domain-containing protein [Catenuloplanes sp.]|jgi:uncharacterized protein (DUF305 family)